jgi:hypothetical protein
VTHQPTNDQEQIDTCYIHGYEPIPETGYYRLCGECYHVFVTPEELVEAYVLNAPSPVVVPDVAEIHFCPHCTHDF